LNRAYRGEWGIKNRGILVEKRPRMRILPRQRSVADSPWALFSLLLGNNPWRWILPVDGSNRAGALPLAPRSKRACE
jgi:hypothetical protein